MRTATTALLLLACLANAPAAHAADCIWNGSAGTWNTPASWSCNEVPGGDDNVTVNAGTVTLENDVTVLNYTQAGGTLTGAFDLAVTTALNWTGGTISTSGVSIDGTLALAGGVGKTLFGTTMTNNGTATYSAGSFTISTAGTFVNSVGATFDVAGDLNINNSSSNNTFDNHGTFRKSAGAGTSQVNTPFDNSGTVDGQTGTLTFNGASTHTGTLSTTGVIVFANVTHTVNTAGAALAFTGSGTFRINGGTLNVTGDNGLDVAAGTTLEQASGTLDADGPVTVTGTFEWEAGTVTGTSGVTVDGTLALAGGVGKTLFGTTMTNNGTATYSAGSFTISTGGTFVNSVGATFDVAGDLNINNSSSNNTFDNHGTFRKSAGAGTSQINTPFDNSGTMSAESGTLDFNAAFDHTDGALIRGTAAVSVSGIPFTHAGDTGPGLSPGTLGWTGNYVMGATSQLLIEVLDDSGPGTGHDQLNVTGNVDVTQGTLDVTALGPAPAGDYVILTFSGAFAGPFATENLPASAEVVYPGDPGGVAGQVILRANAVLPVELSSFTATTDGEAVLLHWATASETNNAGFEVEYAAIPGRKDVPWNVPTMDATTDALHWHTLAFVEGHGTTTEAQRYTYRADDLEPGRYRFRLKQVDFDGAFAYSAEVKVAVELVEGYRLSAVYPNPFNPQAAFTLAVQTAQPVRIVLYDLLGRVVLPVYDGLVPANETQRFEVAAGGLASGTYLLRVEGAQFAETRRLTLLR